MSLSGYKVAAENLPAELVREYTPRGAILEEPKFKVGSAIWCSACEMVSFHPEDVANRYCGACHLFHDDAPIAKWQRSHR
jgi:hypothetical protein